MRVLIAKVRDPAHQFGDDEKKALDRLLVQLDEIDAVKARFARDAASPNGGGRA